MKYLFLLPLTLFFTFSGCSLLNGDDDINIPGKIVFAADDKDGNSQIYSMNANGSNLRQLTKLTDGNEAYEPSWSPDGQQIVFSTTLRSSSNGMSLYLMDANGENMRPLNERENSHIPTPGNNAHWSPDGTRIVFDRCVSCQVGTNVELFLYEFATDSVIQLTNTDLSVSNSFPTWSPDGDHIALITDRDYVDADTMRFRKELYIINADGTDPIRLTKSGFPGDYAWMDNGHLIFGETNRDTGLKYVSVINIQDKKSKFLLKDLDIKSQLWLFWNSKREHLLTINKNHKELPVNVTLYNLNGKQIQQHLLDSGVLESAVSFEWYNQ